MGSFALDRVVKGGSRRDLLLKGKVVSVDLAADLVVDQDQLEDVGFSSVDVQSVVADLPTLIPPDIKRLTSLNNGLTAFNMELEVFPSLNTLNVIYANCLQLLPEVVNSWCGAGQSATIISDPST
jgi:hypothetical protein